MTQAHTGEQVVPGRRMQLVLAETGAALLGAEGRPVVPGRPAADYAEMTSVAVSGFLVRIEFATPGPGWDFAAVSADGAAWTAAFLEDRRSALEAAKAGDATRDLETVAHHLSVLLRITNPHVASAAEYLLRAAAALGATDVHLVPTGGETVVRLRIDGALRAATSLSPEPAAELAARLKALAGLPSYVADQTQYGRLRVPVDGRAVDMRLTTTPAAGGEALALRLLDPTKVGLALDALGLEPAQRDQLLTAARGAGLAVFTGPAGAGKTTTMYALVEKLVSSRPDCSAVTVEQPPERGLEGVAQLDVDDLGSRWDMALQAALRLDPDLLVLGEIRDPATASLAAHASLAGHLLLATMHAGNPAVVPLRLLQLGVPPTAVASGLQVIVAQRLARRVCPSCAEADVPSPEALRSAGLVQPPAGAEFRQGRGCTACLGTGLAGRVGIFEVWRVTERLRALVLEGAPVSAFLRLRDEEGILSARQAALAKAARGEIPLQEIARLLPDTGGATSATG